VVKTSLKNLVTLLLSVSLIIGVILADGCVTEENKSPTQQAQPPVTEIEPPTQETPTQIIEDITPQEALTLIQENQNNPDFVIIDVRTPEEFAEGYIENAVIIDFRSETFMDELNKLDKDKTYIIYCRSGRRSSSALNTMAELNFREAYNILGGITKWQEGGLPTTK